MTSFENLINFSSQSPRLNDKSASTPSPSKQNIPEWYKNADRFYKNPDTGEYLKASKEICPFPKEGTTDDYGLIPSWKACPAILDIFITGYVLKTPCDLIFFKNKEGVIDVKVSNRKYHNFCTKRSPFSDFEHPKGYYENHFAWQPDWGIELPDGYSALFTTPINRFDLPFINVGGLVDCDKVSSLGTFPFFVLEGWEGTISEGTPYMQVIPFKRENWQSKINIQNAEKIKNDYNKQIQKFRRPDGGVYQKDVWSRRQYN